MYNFLFKTDGAILFPQFILNSYIFKIMSMHVFFYFHCFLFTQSKFYRLLRFLIYLCTFILGVYILSCVSLRFIQSCIFWYIKNILNLKLKVWILIYLLVLLVYFQVNCFFIRFDSRFYIYLSFKIWILNFWLIIRKILLCFIESGLAPKLRKIIFLQD